MYADRVTKYRELEKMLNTNLLVYVTSDRRGCETQIAQDVIDSFINQLDSIGVVSKLSLYLYTKGGDTAAAWNIVNLLRQFCEHLQVIVPHKAHSAGTLISIGANSIIMTKQATLGPIDPSLNTPLNPAIPKVEATYPVSVEAVKGYLEFAREELGITDDSALASIMLKLSDNVHPLVLGQVYRSRAQMKMLAEKLLQNQIGDQDQIQRITSFLCSESGSHDYTINRREAKETLGLNIEKPDNKVYKVIKSIYDDISGELGFSLPYTTEYLMGRRGPDGSYSVKKALLESVKGGSYYFATEGKLLEQARQDGNRMIHNQKTFDGWKHEKSRY